MQQKQEKKPAMLRAPRSRAVDQAQFDAWWKQHMAEMKKKESADEKLMFEIAQENKRMSEPLKEALLKVRAGPIHIIYPLCAL